MIKLKKIKSEMNVKENEITFNKVPNSEINQILLSLSDMRKRIYEIFTELTDISNKLRKAYENQNRLSELKAKDSLLKNLTSTQSPFQKLYPYP